MSLQHCVVSLQARIHYHLVDRAPIAPMLARCLTVFCAMVIGSGQAGSADERMERTVEYSAIEGQVSFGPTAPVARPGIPNYQPMQARITVLTPDGMVLDRIEAGADGKFRLEIPPGRYTLHPEPSGGRDRVADRQITVGPGETVKVGINYDSGIR
jgi:hypothetical protein